MEYIFDKSQREALYPFLINSKNEAEDSKMKKTLSEMFDEYLKLKAPLTEGFTDDIILREISKNSESIIVDDSKSKLIFVTDKPYTIQNLDGESKVRAQNEVIHVNNILIREPYQLNFKIKDLDLMTLINIYKNLYNINIIKSFHNCLRNGKATIVSELKKLPANIRTEFYLKLSDLETDKLDKLKNEINRIYNTNYELYEIIFLFDQYLISNFMISDDYKVILNFVNKIEGNKKINDTIRLDSLKKYDDYINYNKYIRILKTLDNWLKIKRKIRDNRINTLDRLKRILTKSELQIVENSYSVINKKIECKHHDVINEIYQNNYIIHDIDKFINHDINDSNKQLICNLCNTSIMCSHVYKIMTNDFKDINEIYYEYKMEEPIGTKFYCKYCGEFLYVADYLEYKGFVKYTSINIDEDETYIKNTTWGILKNLFQDLHFSPKINVELLFNKMNELIFNEAKKFDTFYKIKDPDIRKNNLILYIYIMGGMYAILLISLQKEDNISFNHKYTHTKDVNKLTNIFYNQYITNKWKASLPKISNIKEFITHITRRVSKFNTNENFYNIKNNKLIYDDILNNYDYKILKQYYRLLYNTNNLDTLDEMYKILGVNQLDETDPIMKIKIPDMSKYILKNVKDAKTDDDRVKDYYAKYLYKYYISRKDNKKEDNKIESKTDNKKEDNKTEKEDKKESEKENKIENKYDNDIKYYEKYFAKRSAYKRIRAINSTKLRTDIYENKPIYYVKGMVGFYNWVPYVENGKLNYKAQLTKDETITYDKLPDNPYKDKIKEYTMRDKPKKSYILKVNRELINPTNTEPYKEKISVDSLKRLLHTDINFNLFKNIGNHEGLFYKDLINDNVPEQDIQGIDSFRINKVHSYIVVLYIYLNLFKNNDPKFIVITKTSTPTSSSGIVKSSSDKKKHKLVTNISEYLNEYNKIIKTWNPNKILDWLYQYLVNKLDDIYQSDFPNVQEFYNWFVNYLLNTEKTFTKVDIEKRGDTEFAGDDDFDFDEDNEIEDPYEEIDYEFDEDAEFEQS